MPSQGNSNPPPALREGQNSPLARQKSPPRAYLHHRFSANAVVFCRRCSTAIGANRTISSFPSTRLVARGLRDSSPGGRGGGVIDGQGTKHIADNGNRLLSIPGCDVEIENRSNAVGPGWKHVNTPPVRFLWPRPNPSAESARYWSRLLTDR